MAGGVAQADEDVDLTMIKGHTERAAGKQPWCGAAFSTTNVTLFPMHEWKYGRPVVSLKFVVDLLFARMEKPFREIL